MSGSASSAGSAQQRDASGSEPTDSMQLSPAAIGWAKSYNLEWRRCTAKEKAKKTKAATVAPSVNPLAGGAGLLVAVVRRHKIHENGPVDLQEEHASKLQEQQHHRSLYAVVEKFSVSVMFSRIHVLETDGTQCLEWTYEESNCVESTLFFASFYSECATAGSKFDVCGILLPPAVSIRLLRGYAMASDAEKVSLASVVDHATHLFCMSRDPHPTPVPSKKTKPKAKAAKSQAKTKATVKARGKQSRKRKAENDEEDAENPAESSSAPLRDYVTDTTTLLDDGHYVSGSDDSDADGDESGDELAVSEIKQASDKASASEGALQLPPARAVQETAARLQETAVLAPAGELEEEALLLLVRRARSTQHKRLEVGCRKQTRRPDHMLGMADTGAGVSGHTEHTQPNDTYEAHEIDELQSPDANETSGSEADDDTDFTSGVSVELVQMLSLMLPAHMGRAGQVLARWAKSCHRMLMATHAYAETKTKPVGHDRSISLVMLRPNPSSSKCSCARCKWQDNSQDVLWVHWLYNHQKLRGCCKQAFVGLVLFTIIE